MRLAAIEARGGKKLACLSARSMPIWDLAQLLELIN
jgi:hypothetical protein